jgi:hypothetical protein
MLGQYGFLAKVCSDEVVALCFYAAIHFFYCIAFVQVFSIFEDLGISVDSVATSEVSISLTLDPSKLWSRELIQQVNIPFSCLVLCQQYFLALSYCCEIYAPCSLFCFDYVAGAR